MTDESRGRRLLVYLALALFLIVVLRHAWLCDDAYITFRTVRNVVEGFGARWNRFERVQAYTHPLWMLLLCPFQALAGDVYVVSMALSIALSMAVVWLVAFRLAGDLAAALLALAALISSKAFVDYSTSGLENPLTHLLYAWFLLVLVREGPLRRLTLVAALLALTRLDLFALAVPALIERAVRDRHELRRAALGLAPLLAWELFSLVYYGFPFPNTAYAKLVTGIGAGRLAEQGIAYYVSQIAHDPITLLIIAAGVAAPFVARERRLYAAAIGILLYLAYVVRIGGDFMAGRFFSAPVLGATILLVRCLPALLEAAATSPLLPAGAVAALALVITPRPTLSSGADYGVVRSPGHEDWDARGVSDERAYYYPSSALLRVARDHVPHDDRLARAQAMLPGKATPLGMSGLTGYLAPPDAIIVDTHGLSDPLLARLPIRDPGHWRIGHPERAIPDGYLATLEQGRNQDSGEPAGLARNLIRDRDVAALHDRLRVVTAGPIWRWQRFREILRLNLF